MDLPRVPTVARKIKFRVWDVANKEMFGGRCLRVWLRTISETGYRRFVGAEWMQYTGLGDKNGREIYEGDIVCIDGAEWVVTWDEYSSGWSATNTNGASTFISVKPKFIEVIGNIYESQER